MLDQKIFGERLRGHRVRLNLTQEEVAGRLGVSPQAGMKVPFAVRAYQSEFDQMKTYDSDAEPCELLLK